MAMVSYAQNGEDVMLARALGDIAQGFYIDVGAADPTEHSVTRAFYDRGWHGVNIEPTAEHFVDLATQRPRDVNLQIALDAEDGKQVFHSIAGSGLSTLDGSLAERHAATGWDVDHVLIETHTLASVCEQYAADPIHFLKIDVEGAEARVLRGGDFRRYRPWIVLVEATKPGTREANYAGWEPLLLQAGYKFVWFDGLNRFYVADERLRELVQHFIVPLNLFDGHTPHDPAREQAAAVVAAVPALIERAEAAETRAVTVERGAAQALADAAARQATVEREKADALAREAAADANAATLDARMRSSDALAQAAATNAALAEAQADAARARLDDLRRDIDETRQRYDELRQREDAARLLFEVRQSEAESRIALARRDYEIKTAAHDALAVSLEAERTKSDALEREVAARQLDGDARVASTRGELEALRVANEELLAKLEVGAETVQMLEQRIETLTVPEPAVVAEPPEGLPIARMRRPTLRRRIATGLYRLLLRPFVRPLAWRLRSFLITGVRHTVVAEL